MSNLLWNQHVIEMIEQGIDEGIAAPPLHRVAWVFGCQIPPPLLASFKTNAYFMGSYFGLAFALVMTVMTIVEASDMNPLMVFLIALPFAGLSFGLIIASYYHVKASSLGLLKDVE